MTNIEIEFKNPIDKATYEMLIKKYQLDNNIFLQTNYYFDSSDQKLTQRGIVLRIRHKEPNRYKITRKSKTKQGYLEEHVILNQEKASNMIENGFNLKSFFEDDIDVIFHGKLENYRVSMPYKDGELFLDKIIYFDKVDYELEYEVDSYQQGKKDFNYFLKQHQITPAPAIRKSTRIFKHKA